MRVDVVANLRVRVEPGRSCALIPNDAPITSRRSRAEKSATKSTARPRALAAAGRRPARQRAAAAAWAIARRTTARVPPAAESDWAGHRRVGHQRHPEQRADPFVFVGQLDDPTLLLLPAGACDHIGRPRRGSRIPSMATACEVTARPAIHLGHLDDRSLAPPAVVEVDGVRAVRRDRDQAVRSRLASAMSLDLRASIWQTYCRSG